ncbi:MAG: hypothetical protein VW235_05995, partial [Rhodospirillaceae bacterium]
MSAQLSQSANHRSGKTLAARPDEQFAPKRPSLKGWSEYILKRLELMLTPKALLMIDRLVEIMDALTKR